MSKDIPSITSEPHTIWYHGTSPENAAKIRKEGFSPWTYFGQRLDDAFYYGGGYIFEVALPAAYFSAAGWQIRVQEHVPPWRIVAHYVLEKTEIDENKQLRELIFSENTEEDNPTNSRYDFCVTAHAPAGQEEIIQHALSIVENVTLVEIDSIKPDAGSKSSNNSK